MSMKVEMKDAVKMTGKFVRMWSGDKTRVVEIMPCEKGDDRAFYRYVDTGDEKKGHFDPSQMIDVYDTQKEAEKEAEEYNKELVDTSMNARMWEHYCHNGSSFICERCDFTKPIMVHNAPKDEVCLMADVAEMIGFHSANIWPDLNGFSGYDCIKFEIVSRRED